MIASESTQRYLWLRNFFQRNLRITASRDVVLAAWLFMALACGFLSYVARVHEITHDVFHEMALYREALVRGDFPQEDLFAYTPTVNPAVHHEWATGALLYWSTVGNGMGLMGLSALRLLLMATLWLLLYRVARMRGAHPFVFACVAVACFPFFWVGFATVRAQLFTLVFIAAQMWMQELDWRGRRAWVIAWWFMMLAWLNIHAGFLVGIGMLGFHCLERFIAAAYQHRSFVAACRETWHLILVCLAIPLALPINPYGWQYIPYLLHAVSMPRPLIREWYPLWYTYSPVVTIATFAISIVMFVYALRYRRLSRAAGAAFTIMCAYQTLRHIRHGSIYGTVWLAYVPAWLSHTPMGKTVIQAVEKNRPFVIRTCQAICVGCLAFSMYNHFWCPTLPPEPKHSVGSYPTGAVKYLKQQHFVGNLLTPFNQGAYISWEMYPEVRVSLDGRYEVAYQDYVMTDHHQLFSGAKDWEKILDKYPSDAVLVNQDADLRRKLEIFRDTSNPNIPTNKRWRFVYEDSAFVILAAEHCPLPYLSRMDQPLDDGAWEVFSSDRSHNARRKTKEFAQATEK